jgi:hypothetical protein
MASTGLNIVSLGTAAVFNAGVTGISFYFLDTKLGGYSPWQKAAIASGVGTVSLGVIAIFLSGGVGRA